MSKSSSTQNPSAEDRSVSDPSNGLNLAVAVGDVVGPVTVRELPGGDLVTQFDLTMRTNGRKRSIPVSWPGGHVGDLPEGVALLVVGSIERRFFRAGGATQSRTELLADSVVPLRRKKGVERALEPVLAAVAGLGPQR